MSDQLFRCDMYMTPSPESGVVALDVLAAESNHRIANNLTMIAGMLRLQANEVVKGRKPLDPAEAAMLLSEVGVRIETVGRLHRLLAQTGGDTRLDLNIYLEDVARAAIHSMSGRNVTFQPPAGPPCEIAVQSALSVGFIVGEAVTNALKYAHPAGAPGVIRLDCQHLSGGSTLIRVSDDGVGLPEGFDWDHDGGLGLRMMRLIANQLGAKLTLESRPLGLTASLLLPPRHPSPAG